MEGAGAKGIGNPGPLGPTPPTAPLSAKLANWGPLLHRPGAPQFARATLWESWEAQLWERGGRVHAAAALLGLLLQAADAAAAS